MRRIDYFLAAALFFLVLAGLVILASASSDLGRIKFGDSYYFLKHQLLYGLLPGLAGFFFMLKFKYQSLRKFAFVLLFANLALLTLVFTPFGIVSGGAARWLKFGPLVFQPAEFLKLTFVLYIAAWLTSARANRTKSLYEGYIPFILISGVTAALLLLQPATSTVVILILSGLAMYFISGAKLKYLAISAVGGVAILALIIYATPYRAKRVLSFLHPATDSQGANYHLNQALIAIGSGGLTGVGYGQSTAKINNLPAVVDDSIFAVAAQELGFIGGGLLVILFGMYVFRTFMLARRIRDQFGRVMLVGFGSIIALQSVVNIGAISGVLPLTGVPLPFISYGGTALAVFLTMSGLMLNISQYA